MPVLKREKRVRLTLDIPESLYHRATATGASIEKVVLEALRKRHPVSGPIKTADPAGVYAKQLVYSREYMRRKRKEEA